MQDKEKMPNEVWDCKINGHWTTTQVSSFSFVLMEREKIKIEIGECTNSK